MGHVCVCVSECVCVCVCVCVCSSGGIPSDVGCTSLFLAVRSRESSSGAPSAAGTDGAAVSSAAHAPSRWRESADATEYGA